MELPRNITQVGETDRNCKIYVEDYVVSYMKQMNKFAEDKEIAVALYGKMSEEQQITYCFVYGACVVQSVSGQVRHLSQAQNQEIERLRKKYFPEQTFLGYQILNGEMIEGFRIYDQNSCRYVKGYACFFEKNDAMLAYMLETRREEAQPEVVEQDKYDMVRRRQEDRKRQFEDKKQQFEDRSQGRRRQQAEEKAEAHIEAAKVEERENYRFKVAPFVLLAGSCLIAMTVWNNENTLESAKGQLAAWVSRITESKLGTEEDTGQQNLVAEVLGQAVVIDEGTEQKGTDAEKPETEDTEAADANNLQATNAGADVSGQEMQSVVSTLVTEDKLAEAILEENQNAADGESREETTQSETGTGQEARAQQNAGADQESQAQQNAGTDQAAQTQQNAGTDQESQAQQDTGATQESQTQEGTGSAQETVAQPENDSAQETADQPESAPQPETYIIRQGDTLIAISKNRYGSDSFVSEICALNNISNPDNIQIGQKILLP